MHLTIDANIVVSELAHADVSRLLDSLMLHPAFETLYIAEYTWNEAMQVSNNRISGLIRGGRITQDSALRLEATIKTAATSLGVIVPEEVYAPLEAAARLRMPGDPDDWHSVALALVTETAIWTLDAKHFFGCGIAI